MCSFDSLRYSLNCCLLVACLSTGQTAIAQVTARFINTYGYAGCVELRNGEVRVVLEPNAGGRVLVYERSDRNVLYVDTTQNGLTLQTMPKLTQPTGGRFDIGPEKITPAHPLLWASSWRAEILTNHAARLTSLPDTVTGVQLIRTFTLDATSSKLSCTQSIRNLSKTTKRYSHWGRTFARGNGISLTPLNPHSRYPKGYIIYGPGDVMDFKPAPEPAVQIRSGRSGQPILAINGPPTRPKFVMDGQVGWLAYLAPNNLLFIKKYLVDVAKPYGEMTGATTSIWYNGTRMTEIEPIGPWETIEPGKSVFFTETWWLLDYPFPANRTADIPAVQKLIEGCK